jgi:signal transduction histidine kinase
MSKGNTSLKIVIEKLNVLMSGKIPEKIQPFESDENITELIREINLLIDYFEEISNFIIPLSKGILSVDTPRTKNFLASPFKELHSQLLNLTWQAEEIAKGNYQHRIDFMGDFSKAFNNMVEALDKKTLMLKEELEFREKVQESLLTYSKMLEEANASKDKFFSIIAHDLRSPFNAILGFSELLKEDYESLTDEERKDMIGSIYNSGKSAFSLLENLLIWARSQTHRIEYKPEKFDLSIVAIEAINVLKHQAETKHIKLITEIKYGTLVFADNNMVNTILRNLISNAIKFTNEKGRVIISGNKVKDKIEVVIKDSGLGMTDEVKNNLFNLGNSVSKKGTAGEKGTGLGLLLCKEFIDKHKCKICVESEIGKGSTFKFTLPVAD